MTASRGEGKPKAKRVTVVLTEFGAESILKALSYFAYGQVNEVAREAIRSAIRRAKPRAVAGKGTK